MLYVVASEMKDRYTPLMIIREDIKLVELLRRIRKMKKSHVRSFKLKNVH